MNVFILSRELTIIQIQRPFIASARLKRLCNLLQILPAGGSPGNQLCDFVIEAELILSVLLDVVEGLIRLGLAIRKRLVPGTHAESRRNRRKMNFRVVFGDVMEPPE